MFRLSSGEFFGNQPGVQVAWEKLLFQFYMISH